MKRVYLGIDTSNYTTSLSLCDEKGEVLTNLRKILSVKTGEHGLRQSEAVFQHVNNLPELFDGLVLEDMALCGIGCSIQPRPAEDSYMPVFRVGEGFARALAKTHQVPLVCVSHQENHIRAAFYGAELSPEDLSFPVLATHFSGGTSELLIVSKTGHGFNCECVGKTLDLNAGQLIDRIGVAMGLDFPAGRALEDLAIKATKNRLRISSRVEGADFHFSGQENQAMAMIQRGEPYEDIALALLSSVAKTLERSVRFAARQYHIKDVIFAGGVMSNAIIKNRLTHRFEGSGLRLHFSDPAYTTDNAVGTALLTKDFLTGADYG